MRERATKQKLTYLDKFWWIQEWKLEEKLKFYKISKKFAAINPNKIVKYWGKKNLLCVF